MAMSYYQVSLTTSPQSLATLTSTTAGNVFGFDVILKSGEAAIGYGGNDDLTNTPTNAGFTFTASIGYSSPPLPYQAVSTGKTFLTASGSTVAHLAIWE